MVLCWICNQEEGTTGEHRAKRSDIKAVFGSRGGLYFHNEQRRNRRIQSINSKLIRFDAPVGHTCNTTRTQPHDLAWEALSRYLRFFGNPPLKPGDVMRCSRVFPYDTSTHMLRVHLFFVKWLGCAIVEAGILIRPPLATLSNAIMTGKAHPNIWLSFKCKGRDGPPILASDIDAASVTPGEGFDYLVQFYCVDNLAVRVRFSSVRLPDDWHPKDPNRFVMGDFP
jgi:hypothetical protein